MKNKTSFSAVVELPKDYDRNEVTIDIELDKDEKHLTYDEVEDAIYDKVDKMFYYMHDSIDDEIDDEREDYPTIVSLVINADDGESYPVISESMDSSELDSSNVYTKYLVLPDATYSLTPEALLWMQLKENGIIGKDTPFDYDKYHRIINSKVAQ